MGAMSHTEQKRATVSINHHNIVEMVLRGDQDLESVIIVAEEANRVGKEIDEKD